MPLKGRSRNTANDPNQTQIHPTYSKQGMIISPGAKTATGEAAKACVCLDPSWVGENPFPNAFLFSPTSPLFAPLGPAGGTQSLTWESCLGLGQPKRAELELKLMAPLRLRTCCGTGLSRGSTGSW